MAHTVGTKPRRFEFVGGSSCKFWEVAIHGNEVVVRFGRIGPDGQTNTKSFADETAAAKHAEKLVREKIGKGYGEVAGASGTARADHSTRTQRGGRRWVRGRS